MATVSICSSSISTLKSLPLSSSSPSISSTSSLSYPRFQSRNNLSLNLGRLPLRIKAIEDETTTLIPEEETEVQQQEESSVADQSVSVPVSPSDILTMFFQAEGVMDESAVSKVTKSLEIVEGISDLNVRVLEGIATVELKKQTTVQATGVASNLLEIIQGSGFKLQTLNLSFEDEEDAV